MIVGFALSIEGVEYLFTTSGLATLPTSSDFDWSNAWTVLESSLDWSEGVSWSVRARSDGSMETDSITFRVVDVTPATGSAAGQLVGTYLFTRRPALLGSTRLTVDPGAGGGTLTVDSVARLGLGGFPATVYVDREAVRVSGSADDQHLTVAGGGRGYWGSLAVAHPVDAPNLIYPVVWAALPTIARRKAILWAIDDASAATPIWRGTVGTGPALAPDGASFALQCEGVWTLMAGQKLGLPYASCRIQGYWGSAVGLTIYRDGNLLVFGSGGPAHYRSLQDACDAAKRFALHTLAIQTIPITDIAITFGPYLSGARATVTSASGSSLRVDVTVGEQSASSSSTDTAGARTAVATVARVPPAVIRASLGGASDYYPVDGTTTLPASWTSTTYADAGFGTTVTPSLRAEYSADAWIVFTITGSGTNPTPVPTMPFTGPYVQGTFRFAPRGGTALAAIPPSVHELVASVPVVARSVTVVTTDHFAAGLVHVLDSATPNLRSTIDAHDWEWTDDHAGGASPALAKIVAATAGPYAPRTWELDGGQAVGDVVKEVAAVHALALCTRGGRLALVPVGPATPATAVAATLGEADLCADPTWQALAEEQITQIDVQSDARNVHLTNATAVATYGAGRTVTLKLEGQRDTVRALSEWQDFLRYVMSRVQGPYAEPIAALTIQVAAATWLTTIKCGDYVDVSEWLAPAGDGTRGVGNASSRAAFHASTQRAQVVGWEPDLRPTPDGGALTLTLLLFAQVNGYAPACKVASSGSTTTLTAATAFINGAGDYTDPDAGAADGSGGASGFRAGDRVRLRKINVTTETVDGPYTVQGVSGTTVTLTGAITAGVRTSIAGGDWWDLEYAHAGEIVGGANETAQLGYAFCGSYAAGVIDGTSYPNEPWAP